MRQKAKVHVIPRNTRKCSADPVEEGSVMSGGLYAFSTQADGSKMGQEMMESSSKKSALDLLKLLGLIVP